MYNSKIYILYLNTYFNIHYMKRVSFLFLFLSVLFCSCNSDDPKEYTLDVYAGVGGDVMTLSKRFFHEEDTYVAAIPHEGYIFKGWYDSKNLVSNEPTYQFVINNNMSLIGEFVESSDQYTVTIITSVETYNGRYQAVGGGKVTGSGNFKAGEKVTVTATPLPKYKFVGWFENIYTGQRPRDLPGEKFSSDASYTFTVEENIIVHAAFKQIEK